MTTVNLPVSAGDFLDRLTILQIKAERIADLEKQKLVQAQLADYLIVFKKNLPKVTHDLQTQIDALKVTNEALWNVEDSLRVCETKGAFGSNFVKLARSVYQLNDKRAAQKHRLDKWFGSALGDVKDFSVS